MGKGPASKAKAEQASRVKAGLKRFETSTAYFERAAKSFPWHFRLQESWLSVRGIFRIIYRSERAPLSMSTPMTSSIISAVTEQIVGMEIRQWMSPRGQGRKRRFAQPAASGEVELAAPSVSSMVWTGFRRQERHRRNYPRHVDRSRDNGKQIIIPAEGANMGSANWCRPMCFPCSQWPSSAMGDISHIMT